MAEMRLCFRRSLSIWLLWLCVSRFHCRSSGYLIMRESLVFLSEVDWISPYLIVGLLHMDPPPRLSAAFFWSSSGFQNLSLEFLSLSFTGLLPLFRYAAPRSRSERTKWAVVMSEFAPICIYLVISPLVSLIPLGVPFPFASNSSTYPEKLSAYECGFDPSGDARSRFDIRFYLVSILFIILDPEVTFSFPWAVPLNKIDLFGSWSMMAFLLILTIGFLYEWKRGASDRE